VELRQYARMLAAHWLLVAVVGALAVLVAVLLAVTRQPSYESTATLLVVGQARDDVGDSYQGELLAQARLSTYAALVTEPVVLAPVINRLGLRDDVPGLGRRVEVVVPENTTLIRLTVTDSDPSRARATAAAISRVFIGRVEAIGARGSGAPAVVPVQPATAPSDQVPLHLVFHALLGLVVGVALGAGAAAVREYTSGRVHDAQDAEWLGQAPVRGTVPSGRRQGRARATPGEPDGAYRDVATAVAVLRRDRPGPVVFVSPAHERGTSSLVAHVAVTLARSGVRVVLVTRDPVGGGPAPVPSFVDVVAGTASLDAALRSVPGLPSLVLVRTYPDDGRAPILDVTRLGETLSALDARADLVLIDAPPLGGSLDGPLLAASAATTLMVVRPRRTRRRDVARAVRTLRMVSSAPDGMILDRTSPSRQTWSGLASVARSPSTASR
jgi:capsular polysaccharide biosynthesis protein/Mrp family chromosome partitioning ATPase